MNSLYALCAACLLLALIAPLQAETHRIPAAGFHNTFSSAHKPIAKIRPGDRVITQTSDARGVDSQNRQVGQGPNPDTGPF